MPLPERVQFWREFVARPRRIGSVTPSSARLAREMTAGIDWSRIRAVVEWGPGTGPFTAAIHERLAPGARYLAIELDPNLARGFRRRFPGVSLQEGSAADTEEICREHGIPRVDAILSGLPWAVFPEELQRRILAAGRSVLAPGGVFATFAYLQGVWLPAGRRFRELLDEHFRDVRVGPTVWRNLPPAFIYRCRP